MIVGCIYVLYYKVYVLFMFLTSWDSLQVSIETNVDSPSLGKPVGVLHPVLWYGYGMPQLLQTLDNNNNRLDEKKVLMSDIF